MLNCRLVIDVESNFDFLNFAPFRQPYTTPLHLLPVTGCPLPVTLYPSKITAGANPQITARNGTWNTIIGGYSRYLTNINVNLIVLSCSFNKNSHSSMVPQVSAVPRDLNAAKHEIQKPSTWRVNIVSLQVWVDVSRFSPCMIILSRNKNICCGLKKVVAKSRERAYSEQQILALLLVFHQAHNLSRNKCARVLANQPISALHFFNPQQMFLLRFKLIMQGEKRETSTKTCNETMLRDKLRVFVSRISPPLRSQHRLRSGRQAEENISRASTVVSPRLKFNQGVNFSTFKYC